MTPNFRQKFENSLSTPNPSLTQKKKKKSALEGQRSKRR
jgi:hypothetical protein